MAGYKETPRQKMIGMMYLVLTALLALNVSKEILDAFVIVNEGLETTNEILLAKNGEIFNEFTIQYDQNKEKVGEFYDKAKKAKLYSEDLISYIKDLKRQIIAYTEYKDKAKKTGEYEFKDENGVKQTVKDVPLEDFPLEHISSKDNYDMPWEILGGYSESGDNGEAAVLRDKFNEYKANMINLLPTEQRNSVTLGFDTEDKWNAKLGKKTNWMHNNFYHTILYADVVLLNKFIAEVYNTQAEITNKLFANITKKDFKFDKISAKAIPFSNYVITGEEYKADVFVAAYSTTEIPEVYIKMDADTFTAADIIDDNKVDSVSQGMAKYIYRASGVGEKKYAGVIRIKKPNTNEYDEHFFRNIFTVATPTAVVAPIKMNVLYIGVDNPIAVSVPGVPQNKISPRATGGAPLRPDKGNYVIKPIAGVREITINVGYTNASGENKSAGSQKFRVKRVPDPVAKVAGQTQGNIAKAKLLSAGGILASMEDFDFDLRFRVVSYKMNVTVGGRSVDYSASNNMFTSDMKNIIKKVGRGTPIIFQYITVKGEDGTIRTVNPVALTVN